MQNSSVSLPFELSKFLDRIGSDDSVCPDEVSDLSLPGLNSLETITLKESLQALVARFHDLDKTNRSPINNPPAAKQLQNIKNGANGHVCLACERRVDPIAMTPEETLHIDPHIPSRSATSCSLLSLLM